MPGRWRLVLRTGSQRPILAGHEGAVGVEPWAVTPHNTGFMTAAGRARVTSPRLVGRDYEWDALGEFASVLRDRHPRVALIGGRAGMGKTRLVTEAVLRWRAGGARGSNCGASR